MENEPASAASGKWKKIFKVILFLPIALYLIILINIPIEMYRNSTKEPTEAESIEVLTFYKIRLEDIKNVGRVAIFNELWQEDGEIYLTWRLRAALARIKPAGMLIENLQLGEHGLFMLPVLSETIVYLGLPQTGINNESLSGLKRSKSLAILDVTGNAISDAGMTHLGQIKSLEVLILRDTPITNEGLAHLTALPKLVRVDLTGTDVTQSGIDRFQRLHPHCRIIYGDRRD